MRALQERLRPFGEDREQQRGTLPRAVLRVRPVFPAVPRGTLLRGETLWCFYCCNESEADASALFRRRVHVLPGNSAASTQGQMSSTGPAETDATLFGQFIEGELSLML